MQNLTIWLNRMVKVVVAVMITMNGTPVNAQQLTGLTLDQANQLAQINYPVIRQKDLIAQTADLNMENLNKRFLPQFSVSGQASYQSDVTKINVPIPGFKFEPLSKDQYKALADVDQLIYDGGMVRQMKIAQQLNEVVEEQKVEVELYKLKERINQIFLGMLFLDYQLQQAELVKKDLQTGVKPVEAGVKNGVVLRSNLNVLKAEVLKADQRSIELKALRKGLLQTLAVFINQPLDENIIIKKPVTPVTADSNIARPELKLFNYQSQQLEQQTKLIKAKNLPKSGLFVQGGYGRPGLNFLKNDFSFYYIGGLRVNWPLGGLYTRKKEKELVKISQKMVDIQKETFLLNTNTQLTQQQSEIDKLNRLIETDRAIIDLRAQVKDAARVQLENGVINANDFLREVNAEDLARQGLITHEIQLLQAQINYQTTLGKQ